MRVSLAAAAVAALSLSVPCSALPATDTPRGWRQLGAVPEALEVDTVWAFAVPPAVAEAVRARLEAVSDPDSPDYGSYFRSAREAAAALHGGWGEAETDRIAAFFARSGVEGARQHPSRDSVALRVAAGKLGEMLSTRLCEFEHAGSGIRVVRECEGSEHALPPALDGLVAAVSPLHHFPVTRATAMADRGGISTPARGPVPAPQQSAGGDWPNACTGSVQGLQCGGWITPAVLRKRYGLDAAAPVAAAPAAAKSSLGLVEFSGQLYDAADLEAFSSACVVSPAVAVSELYGDEGQRNVSGKACSGVGACSESLADIQYGGAMHPEADISVIYDSNFDLLAYATNSTALARTPLVQSLSWGIDEADEPSAAYARRVSHEFQKLGLLGTTVVVASGDGGVYGRDCTGGKDLCPTYPATDPHVTAVGGTFFTSGAVGDETCTSWSGGGFSNVFARPSYQTAAVEAYLGGGVSGLPPQSSYNATGRAFPDVSAQSGAGEIPYCVYMQGSFQSFMGTSASAPVVAGILAAVNGVRLAAGKPSLGFANPLLYKNAGAFFDVTDGTNSNGGQYGFPSAPGYDPCSGWGTPRFPALSKL